MAPVVIGEPQSIMLNPSLPNLTVEYSSVTTVIVGKILKMEIVMNISHDFLWEKDLISMSKYQLKVTKSENKFSFLVHLQKPI